MQRQTEYGGRDTASGVKARPTNAITASEKLRLGYLTGQVTDSDAVVTARSWEGLAEPGSSVVDVQSGPILPSGVDPQ